WSTAHVSALLHQRRGNGVCAGLKHRPSRSAGQSLERRIAGASAPNPDRGAAPGPAKGSGPWNHPFWLGNGKGPTPTLILQSWPSPIPQPTERLQRSSTFAGGPGGKASGWVQGRSPCVWSVPTVADPRHALTKPRGAGLYRFETR